MNRTFIQSTVNLPDWSPPQINPSPKSIDFFHNQNWEINGTEYSLIFSKWTTLIEGTTMNGWFLLYCPLWWMTNVTWTSDQANYSNVWSVNLQSLTLWCCSAFFLYPEDLYSNCLESKFTHTHTHTHKHTHNVHALCVHVPIVNISLWVLLMFSCTLLYLSDLFIISTVYWHNRWQTKSCPLVCGICRWVHNVHNISDIQLF